MEDLIYVVSTIFIKDGKVLVSMSQRSAKKGKYTLVGGGVEKGETFKEAAVRECIEEIANGFIIEEKDLKEVLCFREPALSDPSLTIEMHMMLSSKEVDVELVPNEEIMDYKWHGLNDDESDLSTAITDHFIPYAKENNLLYYKMKISWSSFLFYNLKSFKSSSNISFPSKNALVLIPWLKAITLDGNFLVYVFNILVYLL